jgi:WD40 repeat protein
MQKWLLVIVIVLLCISGNAMAAEQKQSMEFSNRDGQQIVRNVTPGEGYIPEILNNSRPIRNPHILGQVNWVDRNHQNAIAANTAVTPDGSAIFAGWWLNNMRYAAYVSAGLEIPFWKYYQQNPWQMPVAASDENYAGTGSGLPAFIWEKDSPLYDHSINFDPGYSGADVSFSGDGNLMATVASSATDGILIIYDLTTQDTVLTRHFEPTQGLYGVDISADGSKVVVSNYGQLYVYTVPQGDLVGTLYNYSQGTARISGDGSRIVTGTYNGLVYLYQWNGSSYDTHWAHNTRHDWVTAVDISKDGSTVACGTLDFVNGQIAGGKFMWWNADSGDSIFSYTDYGDEVSSVALSADGRYAIAGSFGKFQDTFGDVVTCFIQDTRVPIFQLLDDIDEPGSIFSVAMSDSGHYASAGGKAVHAREFGNGGMLYSIKINEP